jgi:hypothetical protein
MSTVGQAIIHLLIPHRPIAQSPKLCSAATEAYFQTFQMSEGSSVHKKHFFLGSSGLVSYEVDRSWRRQHRTPIYRFQRRRQHTNDML